MGVDDVTASNRGPVRVAMIGLGWWGRKMAAVVQTAREDIEIVCAVEPNPDGENFAGSNGFQWHAEDRAALADPRVEAVVLATPHSLHAEQI